MSTVHSAARTLAARTLEWGPAHHDPENPFGQAATEAALDRRDAGADRPDDN